MLTSIQAIRTIATLVVVYFHIVGFLNRFGLASPFYQHYYSNGWASYGVDFFFIVSGFIIVYNAKKHFSTPLFFLKNRLIRIVPLYWIFTTIYLIIYVVVSGLFKDITVDFQSITASYLFFQNLIFDKQAILIVGWTLEYEMLFYFIFTLALFSRSIGKTVFIAALAFMILIPFVGIHFSLMQFVIGMIFGYFYKNDTPKKTNWSSSFILIAGFTLLVINFLKWDKSVYATVPGIAMTFYGIMHVTPIRNRLLIKLGDASYSIYLLQLLTIPVFFRIINHLSLPSNFFMATLLIFICIAITCAGGVLLYKIVELPMSRYLKKRIRSKPIIND